MTTYHLVGGGPSLVDFDWAQLKDKKVIAINRAYEKLPNAEIIYFSDLRFWQWNHKKPLFINHSARKITGARGISDKDIEYWKFTGARGLELEYGKLRTGNSGGYAAINLAFHLGAEVIILHGYDMSFAKNGKTHWHDGYPIINKQKTINKMLPYFRTLVEPLKDNRIQIYNTNKNSAITCFPYLTREEALCL